MIKRFLLLLFGFYSIDSAHACSCGVGDLQSLYQQSDRIVLAKITKCKAEQWRNDCEFEPLQELKEYQHKRHDIEAGVNKVSAYSYCDSLTLHTNKTYLLFIKDNQVGYCSGSGLYEPSVKPITYQQKQTLQKQAKQDELYRLEAKLRVKNRYETLAGFLTGKFVDLSPAWQFVDYGFRCTLSQSVVHDRRSFRARMGFNYADKAPTDMTGNLKLITDRVTFTFGTGHGFKNLTGYPETAKLVAGKQEFLLERQTEVISGKFFVWYFLDDEKARDVLATMFNLSKLTIELAADKRVDIPMSRFSEAGSQFKACVDRT